ncbi:hypothetical protein [Lucifera butyrica]|uniref:hypothetical protein n=1 Tax=Lucifera butyrica TaxID=1351585 RepID=UPI00140294F3|nr:hypothetical protein [Lucifera butyrica]
MAAVNGRRIALSTLRRCHLTSAYDKTILLPGLFTRNDFQDGFPAPRALRHELKDRVSGFSHIDIG